LVYSAIKFQVHSCKSSGSLLRNLGHVSVRI
jgi:hypothetical protein